MFYLMCLLMLGFMQPLEITIVDSAGDPVIDTVIVFGNSDETEVTDIQGRIQFEGIPGDYEIFILGKRYEVNLATGEATLTLPFFQSSINVYPGSSVQAKYVKEELESTSGDTITEILMHKAETSHVGIGGALSTIAIGGMSKHRIQTTINNIRIMGDRRAGSDLATIIPSLLESVNVVRGGTSVSFGSEAMGGVLDVALPRGGPSEKYQVGLEYETNNSRKQASLASIKENSAFIISFEDAGSYTTGDDVEQDGFYSRYNGYFSYSLPGTSRQNTIDLLFSRLEDAGKPSTSSRTTTYPDYQVHFLGFHSQGNTLQNHTGFIFQKLDTISGEDTSSIESMNIHSKTLADIYPLQFGFEVYTRFGVTATNDSGTGEIVTLDDASRIEIAPMVGLSILESEHFTVKTGSRLQLMKVKNKSETRLDSEPTYYLAATFSSSFGTLMTTISHSYRFPTIEEYFYSGLTARGFIEGNKNLEPERGNGISVNWLKELNNISLSMVYNYQEVKNFIEKYELEEDYYSYRNVGNARIQDATFSATLWDFKASVSWAEGTDKDSNDYLDDIPSMKYLIGWSRHFEKYVVRSDIMFVDKKEKTGPSEKITDDYLLLDLICKYDINPRVNLTIKGSNLLNENYFSSADENAVEAPGRSFTIRAGFSW